MCVAFEKTKETVYEFIKKEKKFTWDELQDKVLENGDTLYVSPSMTLSQYMDFFEERDIVYYDGKYKKFGVVKTIIEEMKQKRKRSEIID